MDIERVVFPNVFRSAYYTFYTNMVICPKIDPNFRWESFFEGGRAVRYLQCCLFCVTIMFFNPVFQAVRHVTHKLAALDFSDLEDCVTKEVIEVVKKNIHGWRSEDLPLLICENNQVMFNAPYFVSLDSSGDTHRFKINLLYHYIPGYEGHVAEVPMKEVEKRCHAANYHFERHYRDQQPITGWVITALNHFHVIQHQINKYKR